MNLAWVKFGAGNARQLTLVQMLLKKVEVIGLEADAELDEVERMRIAHHRPFCRDVVGFLDGVVKAGIHRRCNDGLESDQGGQKAREKKHNRCEGNAESNEEEMHAR